MATVFTQALHHCFEAQVENNPTQMAVIFEQCAWTYQTLNQRANQIAHYLFDLSVVPNTPIAFCMPRSLDMLAVILGILKAGCAYLPLDAHHPTPRLLSMLTEGQVAFLLTTNQLQEKFIAFQGRTIDLDSAAEAIAACPQTNPKQSISAEQLAYVIYTSGSTGKPKGVLVKQTSVFHYAHWFRDYSHLVPTDRVDWSCPYIFDMSITTSIVPLLFGATVVVCPDEIYKNMRHYLTYLNEQQITLIKTTPSYFKELTREIKTDFLSLNTLKTIILGGENLRRIDCKQWLDEYPEQQLFNEYGPTEATVAVSYFKVTHQNCDLIDNSVPIGKMGAHAVHYILSEQQQCVDEGDIGELYIGGPCLAVGYLNQPELTAQRFIEHPLWGRLYKTGDLCRTRPTGELEYIGRIDKQVKIRGFRVELTEIEHCLLEHPDIQDVVVTVRETRQDKKQLMAYYILREGANHINYQLLRRYLENHLTDYMIPTAFMAVESLPLLTNGKLNLDALPLPTFLSRSDYVPPHSPQEYALVEIWEDEFGFNPIGIHDNFFALGGHSLIAIRIIAKIAQKLNKSLDVVDFYRALTIEQLAQILACCDEVHKATRMGPLQKWMPLSDFQLTLWATHIFEPKASRWNVVARQRVKTQLKSQCLQQAIQQVLKKHQVLLQYVLKLYPAQSCWEQKPHLDNQVPLSEVWLTDRDAAVYEPILLKSMHELIHFYPWPKDKPLLRVKLFYLDDATEIQISMPHIIADDVSVQILFQSLSIYYSKCLQGSAVTEQVLTDQAFYDYIRKERAQAAHHEKRDNLFWTTYLRDADFFSIPLRYVVSHMEEKNLPYSSYVPLPTKTLNQIEHFCRKHHVNLNDVFCAVLAKALVRCSDTTADNTPPIFMNIVKSSRNHAVYDQTIGCFIRLETIKVDLRQTMSVAAQAKIIHRFINESYVHQHCSSLLRYACMHRASSWIQKALEKIVHWVHLDQHFLTRCMRLVALNRKNKFMINVNVLPGFVAHPQRANRSTLFGQILQSIPLYPFDFSTINGLLDVCFMRDDQSMPHIVISSNLYPAFREKLALEMIQILDEAHEDVLQSECVIGSHES